LELVESPLGRRSYGTHLVWSKNSCGFTLVVFEEASKPFATPNRAFLCCILADRRKEQDIPFSLMVSLVMIMRQVCIEGATQRRFSEQNQPRETLLLDRSHPALRVGVQIRRARWQGHPLHPGGVKELLKGGAVFPVSVMDEVLAR
jgi:hypothetical protein